MEKSIIVLSTDIIFDDKPFSFEHDVGTSLQ